MTAAGGRGSTRQAAHASGWLRHHAIVCGSPSAPARVSRLAENDDTTTPSSANAADAKLSIECGPGIGPSASTSVDTYTSRRAISLSYHEPVRGRAARMRVVATAFVTA